jgi:CelD/BcsL family acetyltransferase involved in cellulose biosynthesis
MGTSQADFSVATVASPPLDSLRVVEVDPQTDARWERFVATHPHGLIYHHPAWLDTLQREYGGRVLGLACEDSRRQLRGVLPLMYTKGLPFRANDQLVGGRLSSLPRTPVSGPLGLDKAATAALVRSALERARARGTRLQLKMAVPLSKGMVEGMVGIPWRLSYVLNLTRNAEDLRIGDGRARRRIAWAVNKAKRLGVEVRAAETERELRAWYVLYLATMRGLGVLPRSYRFFRAAWEILQPRGLMRLLIAEQKGIARSRLLAGSLFLMFGDTVSYAFTGWHRADHALRANDLVHWQAIQDACRQGFRRYDFGEVSGGQEGLAAFKSKWGGEPRQLYRYYYPAPDRHETGSREAGTLHRFGRAAWRRLPLTATARVGNWLYSYL